MCKLLLVRPFIQYAEQVISYKEEMEQNGDDNRVVGMIDFRLPLSDFLFNFGGKIGYSVRPSERKKYLTSIPGWGSFTFGK